MIRRPCRISCPSPPEPDTATTRKPTRDRMLTKRTAIAKRVATDVWRTHHPPSSRFCVCFSARPVTPEMLALYAVRLLGTERSRRITAAGNGPDRRRHPGHRRDDDNSDTVIGTDVFDEFIRLNDLYSVAISGDEDVPQPGQQEQDCFPELPLPLKLSSYQVFLHYRSLQQGILFSATGQS